MNFILGLYLGMETRRNIMSKIFEFITTITNLSSVRIEKST